MTEEFFLRLPATSANLGPAFDAAALGWNRFLAVRAETAPAFAIFAQGRDAEICARLEDHLIVKVYSGLLAREGKPVLPLRLDLQNEIPVGKGCGSSAAARLAGVALASHFGALGWTAQRVFEEAVRLEGHPDNVAACWWGGLVVAQSNRRGAIPWLRLPSAAPWSLLLAVPPHALATEAARGVLPQAYARAAAVANVQNACLMLAAWQQGREDLMEAAMHDQLHQPYRAPLCPLLPALQPLAGRDGIIGCVLSGAGPSVLLLVREAAAARAAVQAALREAALDAEVIEAAVVADGPGRNWRPQ